MNHFYEMDIPATVKQIADRMGEVPEKVQYHMYYFFPTIIEIRDNQPSDQNGKQRDDKK